MRHQAATSPSKLEANHDRKVLHTIDQNIHRDASLPLNLSSNRYGSRSAGSLSKLLNNKRKLTSDS